MAGKTLDDIMHGLHHAVSTVNLSLQNTDGHRAGRDVSHAAFNTGNNNNNNRQDLQTDIIIINGTDQNASHVIDAVPHLQRDVNGTSQGVNHDTDFPDVQSFLHQQNLQYLASLTPTLAYLAFVMVAGTVGNSIVLAVHCRRFRPSVTRTYILAISVCALLTTSVSLPAELVEIRYHATYTTAWACKLFRSVKSFFSFLAACILVAVALERHRKICGPYVRTCAGSVSAGWNLAGCVVFSALITLPYTVLTGPQTVRFPGVNVSGFRCSIDDAYVTSFAFFMYSLATGLTFITCFVIICVSYVRIGRLIWRHQRRRRAPASRRTRSAEQTQGAERKNDLPLIQIQTEDDDDVKRNDTSKLKAEQTGTAERDATNTKDVVYLSPESGGKKENNTFQNARHNLVVVCREQDSVSSDYSSLQPIHVSTASSAQKDNENEISTLMKTVNETSTSEENYTQQPANIMMSGKAQGREETAFGSTVAKLQTDLTRLGVLGGHGSRRESNTQGHSKRVKASEKTRADNNNTHCKPAAAPPPSGKSLRKIPTRTTLTMFVLTVVCVFVNYFPYMLIMSLHMQTDQLVEAIGKNGFNICLRSYFVYTVLNPLVIGFCSARFRRECRHLFTVRSSS